MSEEFVVLVDEKDNEVGIEEKLAAHLQGKLHRAISVFLFNQKKQLMVQQRAFSKYHSGGLWTNACCSHPRAGEQPIDAAKRRLLEEMGIECPLNKLLEFVYRAKLDNGIIEYEFDHVFIGQYDGDAVPNPEEAHDWKWIAIEDLRTDVKENPDKYTAWFKIILDDVLKSIL
jgi:isopentenyl-diphosphate delta-isomerase